MASGESEAAPKKVKRGPGRPKGGGTPRPKLTLQDRMAHRVAGLDKLFKRMPLEDVLTYLVQAANLGGLSPDAWFKTRYGVVLGGGKDGKPSKPKSMGEFRRQCYNFFIDQFDIRLLAAALSGYELDPDEYPVGPGTYPWLVRQWLEMLDNEKCPFPVKLRCWDRIEQIVTICAMNHPLAVQDLAGRFDKGQRFGDANRQKKGDYVRRGAAGRKSLLTRETGNRQVTVDDDGGVQVPEFDEEGALVDRMSRFEKVIGGDAPGEHEKDVGE